MTHRDIRDYLRDILETIDLAESFIQEMTFEAFQAELKTSFAVIHAYFGVDLQVVWDTVHQDLPGLKLAVEAILKCHTVDEANP
jgi:uncharacterized protein with HEPN domain